MSRPLNEAETRLAQEVRHNHPALGRMSAHGDVAMSEAEIREHAGRIGRLLDAPGGPAPESRGTPSAIPHRSTASQSRPARVETRGQLQPPILPHQDPSATRNGRHGYSITRAIRTKIGGRKLDGIEGEVHAELARSRGGVVQGEDRHGFLAPVDVLVESRALDVTSGAGAIGDHRMVPWITRLRNRLLVRELGAVFLSGLRDTGANPRITSGAAFNWLAPGAAPTASEPTIGSEVFTPKRARGYVEVDLAFLAMSDPVADSFIMGDLADAIAAGIDAAALAGPGGDAPVGILEHEDVREIAMGGAPTRAKLNEAIKLLGQTNGDRGRLAWVASPAGREALANTQKVTGSGVYLWEELNSTVGGIAAAVSTAIPDDGAEDKSSLILGDFSDLMVGYYTDGIEMLVNPYNFDRNGIVRINAYATVAITPRRPDHSWIRMTGMTIS